MGLRARVAELENEVRHLRWQIKKHATVSVFAGDKLDPRFGGMLPAHEDVPVRVLVEKIISELGWKIDWQEGTEAQAVLVEQDED